MAKPLFITDERMLQLMEWAVQTGVAENETAFMAAIGFSRTNITNVRAGRQSFTREHILKACQLTGASADYIFGFTSQRLRKAPRRALDQLKEAVQAVELDLKNHR